MALDRSRRGKGAKSVWAERTNVTAEIYNNNNGCRWLPSDASAAAHTYTYTQNHTYQKLQPQGAMEVEASHNFAQAEEEVSFCIN